MAATSLFGSVVNSIITDSFTQALSAERRKELEDIGKAWDFYYGFQEQYIKRYRGEKIEDYIDKDKPTFNYTKAIIDEYVNGVFGKPVVFDFAEKPYQKVWDSIFTPYTFQKILPFFMKTQRVAEVSKTCLVMIRWNKEEQRTYFEDVRGEFVHFLPKPDNPKEIGTVIISYLFDTGNPDPEKKIMKRVEAWNSELWEIWLHNPALGEQRLMASGENPYGFIPGEIFVPQEDDNTFYGLSNIDDIVKVNEVYNNLWVALVQICVMQSFSILFVKSEGDIQFTISPKKFLKLPQTLEAEAEYLTPNPKIEEVEAVLVNLKNELQNISRVPSEVMSSAKGITPESGYALRIKRIPIEEEWEKRRMSYGPSVKNLAKKAVVVDTYQRSASIVPMENIHLAVDFTDTTPPLAPQEQILTDEQHMRYNLITPVDLAMRSDPTLTREEARIKIERNRKEMEELGFKQFGEDNETEFERLKVRMGRKNAGIMKSLSGSGAPEGLGD
jgi:hypothetical protein